MTPEQARHAVKLFENSPEWHRVRFDENAPGRLGLMEQQRALYDAAYPEPDPNAPPAPSPPASRGELDTHLSNHIRFPGHVTDDDRALFRSMSRDALTALGASVGEAGHFTLAASEVLRAPDSYTAATAETALRASWGAAFDANLCAAKEAMRHLPPAARAHLAERPIGNHPRVLEILADAGRRLQGRR